MSPRDRLEPVYNAIKKLEVKALAAIASYAEYNRILTARNEALVANFEDAREDMIISLARIRRQLDQGDIQGSRQLVDEATATITRHRVPEQSTGASSSGAEQSNEASSSEAQPQNAET